MPDANFENTRKLIEEEISKILPLIGRQDEVADKVLKAKAIALIHALEGINEFGDDLSAYGKHVRQLYGTHKAAADGMDRVLAHIGQCHRHTGNASAPASSRRGAKMTAKKGAAKKKPAKKKAAASASASRKRIARKK